MEDLQSMRIENPKSLKEKTIVPQQSLAERILSEAAYFEDLVGDLDSDEENLTEFECELIGPGAPKDQIIIEGTKLSF